MQLSVLNFGIFLVYWIDYGFSSHLGSYAWRVPVILQCVFLICMLFLVWIVDETPRWLAAHDYPEKALDVLQRLNVNKMSDSDIRHLYDDILRTVAIERQIGAGSWKDLLRNDSIQSQRRLLIACGIQMFQQLGGINAIIYYSGTLFSQSIGFSAHMSSLMSGFLQTWFFVASFIPWLLIDRVGRRPLLLSMISLMAAVMAVQAAMIYQVQYNTSIAHSCGIAAAAMLFIFQGAFTIGFQATVWVRSIDIHLNHITKLPPNRFILQKSCPSDFANAVPPSALLRTGSAIISLFKLLPPPLQTLDGRPTSFSLFSILFGSLSSTFSSLKQKV